MLRSILTATVAALAGLIAAIGGTSVHRALDGWGLAVAIGLVFAGAIFTRAWANWIGLASYAVAVWIMVAVFSGQGPATSVLIPDDMTGLIWLIGASAAVLLPAAIPTRWVTQPPRHAVTADETFPPPTSV